MSPIPAAPSRRVPLTVWFAGYLVFAIVCGGIAGVVLVDLVRAFSDPESSSKLLRQPESAVRRVQMIFALLPLPWLLRRIGWRGWSDSGWRSPGRAPARLFARAWAMAVVTLGLVAAMAFAFGGRVFDPDPEWLRRIPIFLAATIVVGVFEETLVRGIFFLPLARTWGAIPAALATSLAFSWAHFLEPAREAFDVEGFLPRCGAVLGSALAAIAHYPNWAVHFANLALMGLVLCAVTAREGSIWTAAGLHAGWVWLKRSISVSSNTPEQVPFAPWVAGRSDFLDGLSTTLILLVLLAWALRRPRAASAEGVPA